jgi:NADP-dependent 3-hydroxy acid dehydrogenase YdfG
MSFEGKVAAVTGAGSGIGQQLALQLGRQGCHVAISDAVEEKLLETAKLLGQSNIRCIPTVVDVSDQKAVEDWANATITEFGSVDYIFNNAGVALVDEVHSLTYDNFHWLMNINFWGVVHGSKAFLPHFQNKKSGHIINISSIFGIIAVPTQSAYNAAKFAVRGFSEAMRMEQADTGVKVTCVHPGGIKTDIVRNGRIESAGLGAANRLELEKKFDAQAKTTAEEAAKVILDGVSTGKPRILIGSDARFLDRLQRLFPQKYPKILGFLSSLKKK